MSADIVRKSVTAQIVDSGSADDPFPGTFEAVLATADMDNEGEAAKKSEWQLPLPDSIPINPDHTMDNVLLTMGSATPELQEDGTLLIKGRYAATDDAQKLRSLVNDKHVTGMSVEFMRKRTPSSEKGGTPTYTVSRELIGGAFTNYPINTHARVLSSKAGARNSKSDAANIQAVHDASMALGADCGATVEKSMAPALKALMSGSVEDLKARLSDALTEFYGGGNECYVWIQATFLTSMTEGNVVYEYNGDTYSQGWTDNGSAATVDGAPKDVSVITTIVTEDDGDTTEDQNSPDDSATKSAANAADDVADEQAKLKLLMSSFKIKSALAHALLAE